MGRQACRSMRSADFAARWVGCSRWQGVVGRRRHWRRSGTLPGQSVVIAPAGPRVRCGTAPDRQPAYREDLSSAANHAARRPL